VLIGCYGDYPDLSLRAVAGVLSEANVKEYCDVHIGANECCEDTLRELRRGIGDGLIDTLIESRRNINKDPMMRLLIGVTETPYLLWMDDDSWLRPGWARAFERFLDEEASREKPLDVAGSICVSNRWDGYADLLHARPWWRSDEMIPESQREQVAFPVGGLFLARTAFLRRHNFPDRGMVKCLDDMLLGDLVSQAGGRMAPFTPDIWNFITISDGPRRGFGEGEDGFRYDQDLTTSL
jgi:hypothetical protein